MNTELFKTKTFWLGAIAVVGSVAAQYFGVEISDKIQTGLIGMLGIFLRDGNITTSKGIK